MSWLEAPDWSFPDTSSFGFMAVRPVRPLDLCQKCACGHMLCPNNSNYFLGEQFQDIDIPAAFVETNRDIQHAFVQRGTDPFPPLLPETCVFVCGLFFYQPCSPGPASQLQLCSRTQADFLLLPVKDGTIIKSSSVKRNPFYQWSLCFVAHRDTLMTLFGSGETLMGLFCCVLFCSDCGTVRWWDGANTRGHVWGEFSL